MQKVKYIKYMKFVKVVAVFLGMAALVAMTPLGAGAAGLTLATAPIYQQTNNNPCVIGDPSCKEPSGMNYTSRSGTPAPGGPGSSYILSSPSYEALSSFNFSTGSIPTSFQIGIDDNFATGAGSELLAYFNTYDCGTSNPSYSDTNTTGPSSSPAIPTACGSPLTGLSYTGPTAISYVNGNGYSDVVLSTLSLTNGHYYIFQASVTNDSDGMEEFFIIPAGTPPVPEPGTLAMLGSGLFGMAGLMLLKRFQS